MSLLSRTLTEEEITALEKLASSRTAEHRLVERARIVLGASRMRHMCDAVRALGVDKRTIRLWSRRFCEEGLVGLQDRGRSGHPRTYNEEARALVVQTALTSPREFGLPFGEWTLERLAAYLEVKKNLPMSPARIGVVLREEGLRWKEQEKWLSSKAVIDPTFVEKRGPLSGHTRIRPRTPSLFALTRWGR